jgi:hypothetical protein
MARKKPTGSSLRRRRLQLLRELPDLERLLRGSVVERYRKCGKASCHCARGKGHGPAYYLSVTLAPGKTRSYYLPSSLRSAVARYLENYKRLRNLNERVIEINLRLLERGELEGDQ